MAIAVIAGIRSHFVKLAGLSLAMEEAGGDLGEKELIVIRAGQHYDWELAEQYIDEYGLSIDVDLTARVRDPRPHFVLGNMIAELEEWLLGEPGVETVAVFGDANASLAGAIAGRRAGKRVAHIEAGLRTSDEVNPEELNRRLIDRAAQFHLASSTKDLANLVAEGYSATAVFTGDVVKDLIFRLCDHVPASGDQVFICIHRKENIGDLDLAENLIHGVRAAGFEPVFLGHPVVMPHLRLLCSRYAVALHGSLAHRETINLVQQSRFGITDSGALQREAYYLDRRLLVRQAHPFWSSLIDSSYHRQVGRSVEEISAGIEWVLAQPPVARAQLTEFGDGCAGSRILALIRQLGSKGESPR